MSTLSAERPRPPVRPPVQPPAGSDPTLSGGVTHPRRYLARMAIFLGMVLLVAAALLPTLVEAFRANPALNALILLALGLGIVFIFRQVMLLTPEVIWLEAWQAGQAEAQSPPRLLAPMARMLRDRSGRLSLSPTSANSLLDGVGSRLDEARELSRYLTGLLIFLGLLGTFWGLLLTVSSIGTVISSLRMDGGDAGSLFTELQQGLAAPLSGMGTAFSSSLFGLAGSLILGFLDLQAGQAQNRFYNDLEDWLSGAVRLSSGGPLEGGEGGASVPAYIQALLETTAESIEKLHYAVSEGEQGRRSQSQHLMALTEKLSMLTDQMRTEQNLLVRLAEGQMELRPVLQRLADSLSGGGQSGLDEATRTHIRNLELYSARLLEETTQGRIQSTQEIRNEIKILTRTIAVLGEAGER